VTLQQRNHDIDTGQPPADYFIFKPVPASWPGSDRHAATPRTNYPEQVWAHGSLSYFVRVKRVLIASLRYPRNSSSLVVS
jgi:hypothetical protein